MCIAACAAGDRILWTVVRSRCTLEPLVMLDGSKNMRAKYIVQPIQYSLPHTHSRTTLNGIPYPPCVSSPRAGQDSAISLLVAVLALWWQPICGGWESAVAHAQAPVEVEGSTGSVAEIRLAMSLRLIDSIGFSPCDVHIALQRESTRPTGHVERPS